MLKRNVAVGGLEWNSQIAEDERESRGDAGVRMMLTGQHRDSGLNLDSGQAEIRLRLGLQLSSRI